MACTIEASQLHGKKLEATILKTTLRELICCTVIYVYEEKIQSKTFFSIRTGKSQQITESLEKAIEAWNNCK